MAVVEVKNLKKRFGDVLVVDDLNLSVERGEILALLGASGCGKTTTLRCIAGFETPSSGSIRIDDVEVVGGGTYVPVEDRNVGMVFQSYAVWPHMTVAENVAFGLKLRGVARPKIKEMVEEALGLVQLHGLGGRFPSELSGGQQQRVALARSVACQPKVLLLDEPLSNLDAKLREQMRGELREVIKRLGMTAIHITHDQSEAMGVADRVAVMDQGRIAQIGTAREIYQRPASRFVAQFVGSSNFLAASVVEVGPDGVRLRACNGLDILAAPAAWARPGEEVVLSIRPQQVELLRGSLPAEPNCWPARATTSRYLGSVVEYQVELAGELIDVTSPFDIPVPEIAGVRARKEYLALLPLEPASSRSDRAAAVPRDGTAQRNGMAA
jgi:ABC-type Fe3+/spermidine/putrescine transport system ATPase subunit